MVLVQLATHSRCEAWGNPHNGRKSCSLCRRRGTRDELRHMLVDCLDGRVVRLRRLFGVGSIVRWARLLSRVGAAGISCLFFRAPPFSCGRGVALALADADRDEDAATAAHGSDGDAGVSADSSADVAFVDAEALSRWAFCIVTGHLPTVLLHVLLGADVDDDLAPGVAVAALGRVARKALWLPIWALWRANKEHAG